MSVKDSIKKFYKRHWIDFHFVKLTEWGLVQKWINAKRGEKICDIGCGEGSYAFKLAKKGCEIYGIDINPNAIKSANRYNKTNKCEFQVAASEKLPFPSNFFDKIFSICAFGHFRDHQKSLDEMSRTLKPSGLLVMTVNSFSYSLNGKEREADMKKYSVKRYYKVEELEKKLQKSNFGIEKSKYILNSPLSALSFKIALKLNFGKAFLALFPVFYPLSKASDFLLGKKDKGIIFVVKAVKN